MVEEASVVVAQEVLAFMATEEMAVSPRARTARLAALVAAAVVVVAGACPMWEVVRASTFKRPHISMLVVEATSMQSAPEETSHASLQRAAC